jgi:hypothetical protein
MILSVLTTNASAALEARITDGMSELDGARKPLSFHPLLLVTHERSGHRNSDIRKRASRLSSSLDSRGH